MRKLLYLSVLLAGVAHGQSLVPIDYSYAPPSDWPKLDERITYLEENESIQRFCNSKKWGLYNRIKSCAVLSFEYELCMIYVQPNDEDALKHERAHCAGYSHVGEGGKAHEAWERWKGKRTGGLTAPQ
jgi:hypothetical protein